MTSKLDSLLHITLKKGKNPTLLKTGSLAVCGRRDEMQFLSAPRVSNHATSQMFMPFDTCFAFTLPIQQSTYRILWPEISLGALTQKEMPQEKRTESASIICYLASGYDLKSINLQFNTLAQASDVPSINFQS